MKVLLRIRTKVEIFGCDEFPIVFNDYHTLCKWLLKEDNKKFVDKILDIREYYQVH